MTARFPALTGTLLLVACSAGLTGPGSADGPLRLEASITRSSLPVGESATLLLRLVNTGARPVTLNFGSGCQILPYIRAAESDEVVYPSGGAWACFAVLSQLTIPARDAHEVRLLLLGGAPQLAIHSGIPVGVGRYVATAEIHSQEYQLQSDPVTFTVE